MRSGCKLAWQKRTVVPGGPVDDSMVLAPNREFASWTLVKEEGRSEWIDEYKIPVTFDDAVTFHAHAGHLSPIPEIFY